MYIHVLMRDEKEGRKKHARSNKQQGKATQHMYMQICVQEELKLCINVFTQLQFLT